jgi:hypothetical protein
MTVVYFFNLLYKYRYYPRPKNTINGSKDERTEHCSGHDTTTKNKRKFSPTLGCVMGPILTSLSNDIFHVFSPVVSCPLQCSVRSSLLPFIVFLGRALSMSFSDYFLMQLLRFSLQMYLYAHKYYITIRENRRSN